MKATIAILLAAWMAPAAAIAQEWKVYSYPDAGVAVQFPAPPSVEKTAYKTPAGASLPMTRYSLKQDGVLYSLSIVDYTGVRGDEKGAIAETEKSYGALGKVTVAIDARVNRSFGRELSVNRTDGGRSVVAIFFVNKHLYISDGESLPPNPMAKSGDAIRFQQSLEFIGDNGGFGFGGLGPPGGGRFGGPGGGRFAGGFGRRAAALSTAKSSGDAMTFNGPAGPPGAVRRA